MKKKKIKSFQYQNDLCIANLNSANYYLERNDPETALKEIAKTINRLVNLQIQILTHGKTS